jgi:hypothetical protein
LRHTIYVGLREDKPAMTGGRAGLIALNFPFGAESGRTLGAEGRTGVRALADNPLRAPSGVRRPELKFPIGSPRRQAAIC